MMNRPFLTIRGLTFYILLQHTECYASYFERRRLAALIGQMEQNSGPVLIAYERCHAAFIGNVRGGVCACHRTPHLCGAGEGMLGQSQGFWAIWLSSGLQ